MNRHNPAAEGSASIRAAKRLQIAGEVSPGEPGGERGHFSVNLRQFRGDVQPVSGFVNALTVSKQRISRTGNSSAVAGRGVADDSATHIAGSAIRGRHRALWQMRPDARSNRQAQQIPHQQQSYPADKEHQRIGEDQHVIGAELRILLVTL